jgi:restriction system protein
MADATMWGIHGGRTGDADSLFLKKNFVAVGWAKTGDLSKLEANRDAFKAVVAKNWPEKKPGAIPNNAGQLFRFVHEMQPGNIIVYPSKADRQVHLGRVEGPYRYEPTIDAGYPHLREVKWLTAVSRTRLSQGALYEIGSALSLFQVKNYADEYRTILETKDAPAPMPVKEDETFAEVSKDVEETTRDFVLKTLAQQTKGHPFAHFVGHLLEVMGYKTRISPEGPDGGVDIIAHRDELGFEPPIIKVQVKSTEGKVGDPEASALYGKLGSGEHALLVTLGYFSPQAKAFERSKSSLRLIDGEELVRLVLAHYENFDGKYKQLLPLRRVYVPDLAEVDE